MMRQRRNLCFVTGTRAEFGLMASTLRSIQAHPHLKLQLLVTGMHLDSRHGRSLDEIRRQGWKIDAVVPWSPAATPAQTAAATGQALAKLAHAYQRLDTDIVLVVGDRVEAFAAASAAHIAGKIVAHVHGGDRALGQVDDALRHAITKLAHIHFPATATSAQRLRKLGEQPWRIFRTGTPGLDGLHHIALPRPELRRRFDLRPYRYALLVLHPAGVDENQEYRRAALVLRAVRAVGYQRIIIIHPNNDPGSPGIARRWQELPPADPSIQTFRDTPRDVFLGLLRDAAVLVGNSSAGIIEAAPFGTPVLDIGPRQQGRECASNVRHLDYDPGALLRLLTRLWNHGRPRRWRGRLVYAPPRAGHKIPDILGRLPLTDALRRKLIAY